MKNCAKYGPDPNLDPKPEQKLFATGSGITQVIALREHHDTVLNKYGTGILISGIGGSPEERTAGRQDELVSLHRVSITHLK